MFTFLNTLWTLRRYLIGWLIPVFFSPILFLYFSSKEARCAYVVLVMICYWFSEVIPMAITALIPLVLFPLLGVLSSDQVTESYIDGSIMILLGSLIAACAVQESNLHQRIALRISLLTGTSPKRLLLGFMLATAFLSMLVNGVASVALMIPIVNATLDQICRSRPKSCLPICPSTIINYDSMNGSTTSVARQTTSSMFDDDKSDNDSNISNNIIGDNVTSNIINIRIQRNKESRKLKNAIFLSICYAANIGSIGTLTGTPVNLVLNSFLKDDAISFSEWFFMNFPGVLLLIMLTWCFLSYFMIESKVNSRDEVEKINMAMRVQYEKLGMLSFHELAVLVLFALLVVLWFFRAPDFMTGWAPLITEKPQYIQDSLPTMFVVIMFFLIPANLNDLANSPMLLDWKSAQEHVSWSIILLLGGGLAMARGCIQSGLSQMLGNKLIVLDNLPHTIITLIMCLSALSLTELISNTATCSILLPVVFQLTSSVGMNSLSIVLPVTISCSFAFMFPFSSGPTAIIYEASGMKNTDMIIPGTFVKMICLIGLIAIQQLFWTPIFFQHGQHHEQDHLRQIQTASSIN